MDAKLKIKICTGTLCYVMGGAELQMLGEYLPSDIAARVDIKGSPCLNHCHDESCGKAPFVEVGDTTVSSATIIKVIEEIKAQLNRS